MTDSIHFSMRVVVSLFALGMAALSMGVGGEDPSRVSLQGTVTLNGIPLNAGTISFVCESNHDQPITDATFIRDGKYFLVDSGTLIPGAYQVRVELMAPDAFLPNDPSRDETSSPASTQSKLNLPEGSSLTRSVQVEIPVDGCRHLDFDLK